MAGSAYHCENLGDFNDGKCYFDYTRDTSIDRIGYFSHAISRDQLEPGDHIYCYKRIIADAHHGIYTGKEGKEVIHMSGTNQRDSKIQAVTLDEFLGDCQLRLVPYNANSMTKKLKHSETCSTASCLPAKTVVCVAEYLLEHSENHRDLFNNNGQVFADYCKVTCAKYLTFESTQKRD